MQLVNCRLLDGLGGIFDCASIEIDEEGRIARVNTGHARSPLRPGAFDLQGQFLLPGLIDCHVHLTADASADPVAARVNSSEGYLAILASRNAERTLRRGVTTVRDTGAPHFVDASVKRAIEAGLIEGPRMLSSGKMLTMTGGHGCLVGQEIDGPVEARKFARLNLKMGADNIKMVASGGIMTPNVDPRSPSLTVEEMAAGFEEAHKAGKLTACHAHSLDGVKNAIKAGVRTVEHGVWLDEEACDMMLRQGCYLCPTLSVVHNLVSHSTAPGILPHVREKVQMVADALATSFRLAVEKGVRIICGTDAGMPYTYHGETAHEVRLMVAAGVAPHAAIVNATSLSAEALKLSDRTGAVEVGRFADLIVVEGDPTADIAVLSRPSYVFRKGKPVLTPQSRGDFPAECLTGDGDVFARNSAPAGEALA
jgi:imidazolonepropionase-like amidohydrolase